MEHKLNMMMLLILLLSSCASIPNQRWCDISFIDDPVRNMVPRCRCRWVSNRTLKALTDPVSYPLEECEGIIGINIGKLNSEVIPNVKDKIRECEDLADGF